MGNHILLIGFMGSGKTTVSRRLARATGLPLIDTDQRIEQMEVRTIKEIFAQEGEAGFRAIETRTLAELADIDRAVISCGGGVIYGDENHRILKELGTVVYLKISLEGALARISDPSTRPLLNGPRPVQEIYDERLALYEMLADVTVDVESGDKEDNFKAVLAALSERGVL